MASLLCCWCHHLRFLLLTWKDIHPSSVNIYISVSPTHCTDLEICSKVQQLHLAINFKIMEIKWRSSCRILYIVVSLCYVYARRMHSFSKDIFFLDASITPVKYIFLPTFTNFYKLELNFSILEIIQWKNQSTSFLKGMKNKTTFGGYITIIHFSIEEKLLNLFITQVISI